MGVAIAKLLLAGGHRVEATRLTLHVRPHARLAQVQEPGGTSGEAGGRRGLGQARVAVTQNKETRPNDPGLSSMDARALEFAGGRPGVNAAGRWRFQALRPKMSEGGDGADADGRVRIARCGASRC